MAEPRRWLKPACLIPAFGVATLQAVYVFRVDALGGTGAEFSEVAPLYSTWGGGLLSVVVIFGIAWWGFGLLGDPRPSAMRRRIGGSVVVGGVAALMWFQFAYGISRFPAVTDVSLPLAFRPWTRILPGTLIILLLATIFLLLFVAVDAIRNWDSSVNRFRSVGTAPSDGTRGGSRSTRDLIPPT